jgi:hypothetical protein
MIDNSLGMGRSELSARWQLNYSIKFTKLQLLRNRATARAGCPTNKSTAYGSLLFVTNTGLFVVGGERCLPRTASQPFMRRAPKPLLGARFLRTLNGFKVAEVI